MREYTENRKQIEHEKNTRSREIEVEVVGVSRYIISVSKKTQNPRQEKKYK